MGVSLECGELFPTLQKRVIAGVREALQNRADPLSDQILVIVPTRAMRAALLRALAADKSDNFYGLNLMSINHLAIKIVLDTLQTQKTLISDSTFFPFALYNIAVQQKLEPFESFRVCQALYQSIRDLIDGGVTADLFRDALEDAKREPEIAAGLDFQELGALQRIYSRFETFLHEHQILNLQTAASQAVTQAANWAQAKNISSLIVYGFYDATQTQCDVLEELTRSVSGNGGAAQIFFPFPVRDLSVEFPAAYAQPFFERIYSLTTRLSGEIRFHESHTPMASANIESVMFSGDDLPNKDSARVEFLSAAGPYDEAWAVAKRILYLVKDKGVSFDQILVISRTLDDPLPLMRVFEENRIPCNLVRGSTLAEVPYARFASLILRARQARFNAATVFEFLSAPFIKRTGFKDLRNISDLMERLFIRNWDDWDRLKPLLQNDPLPRLLDELIHGDEQKRESWKYTARSLLSLRKALERIPETASLPQFTRALIQVLDAFTKPEEPLELEKTSVKEEPLVQVKNGKGRNNPNQLSLSFDTGSTEAKQIRTDEKTMSPAMQAVMNLLRKLADFSIFGSTEITLAEFAHLLELYLKQTSIDPGTEQPQGVTIGDVMQLRGVTADYVFLMHMNREVFPRRLNEDPFLPDTARKMLINLTGAGPAMKRASTQSRLFQLKDGGEEELLLFAMALRSAREHLFLSYQRADAQGRKLTCSAYFDEVLRVLTNKTSQDNPAVCAISRQLETKLMDYGRPRPQILPTPSECSALADWFSSEEVLNHTHHLPPEFSKQAIVFAHRMNSYDMNEAAILDGCIEDPARLWSAVLKSRGMDYLRLSYSTMKSFFSCPFQFFGTVVLKLEESPKETENDEQDMDAMTKGILAETVVKGAINIIKNSQSSIDQAVKEAVTQTREKYRDVFPPLILNLYMKKFQHAAENLLRYLQSEGYDLKRSIVPEFENKETVELLNAETNELGFPVIISGVLDLITFKAFGGDGLISDLKWGGSRTANTPNAMHQKGELQFCLYPAMYEVSSGEYLPFRYFRLNIFEQFGDPNQIEKKLRKLGVSEPDRVMRYFGGASESAKTYLQEEQFLKTKNCGIEMLKSQFRILKDPGVPFSECKYCSYTQLCRRSHASTLLRTRMADLETK